MNQYSFPFLNIVLQNTTRECRVSEPARFGIVSAQAPAPEIKKTGYGSRDYFQMALEPAEGNYIQWKDNLMF